MESYYKSVAQTIEDMVYEAMRKIADYVDGGCSNNLDLIDATALMCESIKRLEDAINWTYDAGFESGYGEGRDAGYDDGYTNGYRDGQESNARPDDAVTDWMTDPEGR